MAVIPRFITRVKPMNGITPFTYRDGLTYLEVLEEVISYIQHHIIVEINDAIEAINAQGDEMTESFNALYDETQQRIDDLISDNEGRIDELENLINEQITNIVNMQQTLADYYDVTSTTLDDKFEELDLKIAAIDDRLALIDWLTPGPPTQFVDLQPGTNTVEINELWAGWPIEYVIRQDSVGGRSVTFPSNVTGNINLNTAPGMSTRIRLIPQGDEGWIVDNAYDVAANHTEYALVNDVTNIDTTNRYCAYPVAAHRDGVTVLTYTRADGHYGGNSQLVIRRSANGGQSWSAGSITAPDPGSATFGISGVTRMPNGFGGIVIHDNPLRMFFVSSPTGTNWTAGPLIAQGFPTDITWVDNGTPNGILVASLYRGSWATGAGVRTYRSTDLGATWTQGHVFQQLAGDGVSPLSETSIIQINGPELLAMFRYDPNAAEDVQHYMSARSYDYGVTWTNPEITIRDVTGHPRMQRLPNGDLMTPLRHATTVGSGSSYGSWGYATSHDNGRTWRKNWSAPHEFQLYGSLVVREDNSVTMYGAKQLSSSRAHVFSLPVKPYAGNSEEWDTGWISLPLSSGVTAVTGCYYRRVGKMVALRGLVDRGNGVDPGPVNLFGPLEGWGRPPATIRVPVAGDTSQATLATGALELASDGIGKLLRTGGPSGATSQYAYLNGITYMVD